MSSAAHLIAGGVAIDQIESSVHFVSSTQVQTVKWYVSAWRMKLIPKHVCASEHTGTAWVDQWINAYKWLLKKDRPPNL